MVYETEFYTTRRPYSSYSSRPTISSYNVTPFFGRSYYDDNFISSYNYYSPIRVLPTYSRVGSYISRPSFRFNYDIGYDDVPYHHIKRVIPIPSTRISTIPSRVFRERLSPIRIITPSSRVYHRDVASPVRVITSPGRIVNIRVRPSTLAKEFDRIDRKYRTSPIGVNDTEHYLNSAYAMNFSDATRDIRASTQRLMREIHEPVQRAQSVPRFIRASSLQPTYSRFDPDLIDKYGNALIDNEYFVNKMILRPTRKVRDNIEILSNIKYREPPRRYTAKLGLDPARASRKFNEQKQIDDPSIARAEVEALKAANRLERVKEVDEDMEKIKQKRMEERRLREEQALMEEQVKKQEQAKKEEADRQAEIQRQERLAAQAAAERQAEIERKAAEEAQLAEEARLADEARQAEERRAADEADAARAAEAARIAAEEAKKAEEEKRLADEAAAKQAEEERLAEEARLAEEEAAKKAEEERLAELEKIKAEEAHLAELEARAKEDEDNALASQANELAELARSQTQELEQNGEEETAAPAEEEAATVEEAETVEDEAPIVEEPVVEESEPIVEEPTVEEPTVEEPAEEEE